MAWHEGFHTRKGNQLIDTNRKLGEIQGELTTEQAQICFAQYCCANPSFAANLLMGIQLYPFQDLMIRAMFQKDFFLGICSRGLGKCVRNSLTVSVLTKKDGLISIPNLFKNLEFKEEEYIKEIPEVELWNGESFQKTNRILVQGGKESSKVTTRMGYELEGSPNHRIKVLDKRNLEIVWKRYKELDPENDFICISRSETPDSEASEKEINEAYLCGLLIGDGSLRMQKNSFVYSYTSMDKELLNFVLPYSTGLISNKKGNKAKQVRLKTSWAEYLLLNYELKPALSYDKVIPSPILRNKKLLKACIQGIADTDGGREAKGAGFSICTTSKVMAHQIHLSLLNFGIISRLREWQTKLFNT